jgi:hypothetical protein
MYLAILKTISHGVKINLLLNAILLGSIAIALSLVGKSISILEYSILTLSISISHLL